MDELERVISESGEPAFVIIEAVQGEGGYIPAGRRFMQELRRITSSYKVPLICDEVQCGLGRTGEWWGFQNYGIVPDIMACGKALQVGAAVTSREYEPLEKGAVSSTWGGGHRIDMAVGKRIIEVIKRDRLMLNAKRIGTHIMKRLDEMEDAYGIIREVRGLGLMIGADAPSKEARDFLLNDCFRRGLFLLGCGSKSIRFAPPMIITEEEADIGLDIFEEGVKKLAACKRLPPNWRPKICPTGVSI
jgi:4-aminobutyrate aminotransferase